MRMSAVGPGLDDGPDDQLVGGQDVALLAVAIDDQGDTGVSVGIVLMESTRPGTPSLCALEVDEPVRPLMTAALMPRGDAAVVVAATLAVDRTDQRLLGLAPVTSSKAGVVANPAPGMSACIS